MEEYYKISYKSNPHSLAYLLQKSDDGLKFMGTETNPSKLGISLDEKRDIIYPKYLMPLRKIEYKEVSKLFGILEDIEFERKLNKLKINL